MPSRNLHAGFLATRVGRRTLFHFLSAALLPVLVSSLVGIWYVRQTLTAEAAERVDRTAEAAGLILLRQLDRIAKAPGDSAFARAAAEDSSQLTAGELEHLQKDRVVLKLPGGKMRILKRLADGSLGTRLVAAQEIWPALDELIDSDRTALCVFVVRSWQRLHCSESVMPAHEQQLRHIATASAGIANGSPAPNANDDKSSASANIRGNLLSAHRDIYLRYELASPEWRVVTSEDRRAALAPASSVTKSLSLLIALAMVSAFTFAHRQIRRSTQPLEALRDATRRVEAGDLETPVIIASEDEYGELGTAFNGMTNTLSRQLTLLRVMDDVDQATLRHREIEVIADIALDGLRSTQGLVFASCAIVNEYSTRDLSCWSIEANKPEIQAAGGVLEPGDRTLMLAHPRQYGLLPRDAGHLWIPGTTNAMRVVFPLIHDGELLGATTIAFSPDTTGLGEELKVARRIADRVGLGIANVRLLDRLNALSSGTLLAFARAIDANSPWTAGHSERVTQLAIALGRELGLGASELSTLYRGGLMHDIGKIGIPPAVLDKAGRLDDAERALIETHPEIGERILRPIPAFADALGIVRSHHERFDGQGYPDRLAGEQIPWLARILAVADVFDAMASDRPYRAGLSHRATITMIEGNSGTHFDPRVVDALIALEQKDPAAFAQQTALSEIMLHGTSFRNTPHNAMAAIR